MRLKKIFAVFFWVLTLQSSYSQCFNIESILVDACDSGTNEGFNEMFRMRIGSAPLSTSSMSINWPAQSWLGLIQNATTAAKVNELNDAITAAGGCGQILEPTGGVLPANSTVIVVTSFNLDTTLNSFGALTENIYMLFQNNPSTTAGHFANYNSTPGLRTLTVNFGAGCSDTVTYQRSNLINIFGDPGGTDAEKNGATVNFTPSGTPSYINNGCIAPIPPFTVQVVTFPISACAGQTINLNGSAQGQDSVLWTSTSGNFSSPNTLTTTLTIPTSASIGSTITATLGVTNFCGTTITDQITITVTGNTLTLNSSNNNQNICSGNAITPIQYTFGGGATGVNITGLPAGITATTSGNIVTISGTTSNSFSYTIETVGGCGTINLSGTVTINPNSILTLNTANNNQNICSGNAITPIQYTFGGGATGVNVTGLPAGIIATTSGNIVTISGTTSNSFSYTIQTVGGCDSSFQNGAITFSSIITPTFNLVDPICDVSNVVITNISLEGIEGSWSLNSQNSISATFLFTPNPNQCANTTVMTIAIIPSPVVTYSPNPAPSLCSGESLMLHLFSSVPGTTFTWTVLTNGASGASAGSGNIIDQTLATTSTVAGTAIYTITPSLNGCDGSPIQVIATVNPLPNPILQDGFICVDASENNYQNYSLTSGINGTNFSFDWHLNGELIPTATGPNYEATAPGNYSLIVTNTSTGCISDEVFATVSETNLATAMTVDVTNAFTDNATITVNVTGGNGSLLYQLDDEGFQESNIFTGVSVGPHQITVIDTQGCTLLTQSVLVIDYPTFFTPNGDGYNDTWNIIGLKNQLQSKIFIFDRYGKLLKQISPSGAGWDGKFNGIELPSTDYWFTVEYQENDQQKEFKAHFSLIR